MGVISHANNELQRMGHEPVDMFNEGMEDSIQVEEQKLEPDTDHANSGAARTESQSVNINVASTSQFGAQDEELKQVVSREHN